MTLPELSIPEYQDYYVIGGDDFIIIGDIEIPDHDESLLNKICLYAKTFGITKLIIAGDFLHLDMFSPFASIWARTGETNFEDSLSITKQILYNLKMTFSDIWVISGNHDYRISKATNGQVHLGMFLDIPNVHFSRYSYMFLKTSREYVYIGHHSGRAAGMTIAQTTYNVVSSPENDKCAVILPHYHFQASTWSVDGLHELHILPCIRNPKKTMYKQLSADPYRKWQQGGLAIKDGYFYPLNKNGTNWNKILG